MAGSNAIKCELPMDTLQHAYDGYVIAKAIEVITGVDLPGAAEFGSALVGALPDLIGEAERVIKHDVPRLFGRAASELPMRSGLWNWYNLVHTGMKNGKRTWWWYIRFVPQWGKHILKDRFTHMSMGARRDWYPPAGLWREDFLKALAYCWPNWVGWIESLVVSLTILVA
jgi:hypothetical protein